MARHLGALALVAASTVVALTSATAVASAPPTPRNCGTTVFGSPTNLTSTGNVAPGDAAAGVSVELLRVARDDDLVGWHQRDQQSDRGVRRVAVSRRRRCRDEHLAHAAQRPANRAHVAGRYDGLPVDGGDRVRGWRGQLVRRNAVE